jgi:hypothetical protein
MLKPVNLCNNISVVVIDKVCLQEPLAEDLKILASSLFTKLTSYGCDNSSKVAMLLSGLAFIRTQSIQKFKMKLGCYSERFGLHRQCASRLVTTTVINSRIITYHYE